MLLFNGIKEKNERDFYVNSKVGVLLSSKCFLQEQNSIQKYSDWDYFTSVKRKE